MGTGKFRRPGYNSLRQTKWCFECNRLFIPTRRYPVICPICSKALERTKRKNG